MTLTDAGPLIALINRNDPNHQRCAAALSQLPSAPLVTTWPSFTEAMYLLRNATGFSGQQQLWRLLFDARLVLHELTVGETRRAAELMEKYSDRPMDLADATLVSVAERLSSKTIFSLDSDFHIYRLANGTALSVVP